MEISPQKITNKIKKIFGGNWGHPRKFVKRHTNIPDPLFPDPEGPVKMKSLKRKHKHEPKPYPGHCCPFCGKELPIDETKTQKYFFFSERVNTCPVCKAYEVPECPACKRKTWYDPESRIFKHQGVLGCGFNGLRKLLGGI